MTKKRFFKKVNVFGFDLSVRAINALRKNNIETIGDLLSYREHDLRKFRCAGKKTREEIVAAVHSQELHFFTEQDPYNKVLEESKRYWNAVRAGKKIRRRLVRTRKISDDKC